MRLNAILLSCLLWPVFSLSAQDKPKAAAGGWISPQKVLKAIEGISHASIEEKKALHGALTRAFGLKNLAQGRAAAKIEETTVLWATLDPRPASVFREDGNLIGEMVPVGHDGLQVLAREMPNFSEINYRIEAGGRLRMAGSARVEHFPYPAESLPQPGVPQGRLEKFEWKSSKIFPDTVRDVIVYLPANHQAQEETCLMVWQDGSRHADPHGSLRVPVVFDNLIHQKAMPRTVGIFIDPGRKQGQKPGGKAGNRGFEYDSLGDAYVRFLLEEILPEVERRHSVKFLPSAGTRAIAGGSSGGICAFTAAWERPDQFGKVLSWVGSFVNLRGGHSYPSIIRLTERKPIRVYLLDGENDLDNAFGNWPLANKQMAAALRYMKYDFRIDWNLCFHGSKGMAPALPEALRWLWRDTK